MKKIKDYEFWFIVGSQYLYGPEVLETVSARAAEMSVNLNKSGRLPCKLVFKTVVKTPEEATETINAANYDDTCAGVITWCHTFSPSKMWLSGLNLLQKPWCHLATQYNRSIPDKGIDMDFMNLNQAAHGDPVRRFPITSSPKAVRELAGCRQVKGGHKIIAYSLAFLAAFRLVASDPGELQAELRAVNVPLNVCTRAVPGTVGGVVAPSVPLAYGYADDLPTPVAAASTLGRGRIVAVGHGAFLNKESMDAFAGNRVFREASLRWLNGGRTPSKIWIDRACENLAPGFAVSGRTVETIDVPSGLAALPPDAVVVLSPESHALADIPAIRAFIEKGGNVLCRVVGWGWHQMNPGKSFRGDNGYNVLLAGTGLATDGRTQTPTGKDGYEVLPSGEPILEFLGAWQADPVRLWPARPEAAVYPGLPPEGSERVTRTVDVDLAVPRWHGTGLFAVAGEPLTVTLPEGAERLGLKLRIGSTECRNMEKRPWKRSPIVDVTVPLDVRKLELSSPFGGLVYVVVPDRLSGKVAVEIGPACPAPTYVLGRDTAETWKAQRAAPAPMAELASGKLVLTVPSDVVRDLDDPAPLLRTWNEVIDLDAKLTGLPSERKYPERMCADVQLCCGLMHSGYPIMFPVTAAKDIVDNETLRHARTGNVWGFYHEMGHNHQNYDWTFDGSVEVTVNFFTLYCYDKLCGLPPRKTRMGEERLAKRVRDWEEKGRPLDVWKKDPFLALDFFVRLQERYGWEPFEKMFAEYRALAPEERPKTDLDKRRQWAQRFSRIVGEDLTREFAFLTDTTGLF